MKLIPLLCAGNVVDVQIDKHIYVLSELSDEKAQICMYNSDGSELKTIHLSNRALVWDVQNGLWGWDEQGLWNLEQDAPFLKAGTWLSGLGAGKTQAADVADDVNGDGVADLVWFSGNRLKITSTEGELMGEIVLEDKGEFSLRGDPANRLQTTRYTPYWTFVTVGSERQLMVVQENQADLYRYNGSKLSKTGTKTIPFNVSSDEDEQRLGTVKFVPQGALGDWYWQIWHMDDSWFGSTVTLHRTVGQDWSKEEAFPYDGALVGLELHEDGGELGVYALGMDISITSLAKALFTQSADLTLLRLEDTQWNEKLQFSLDVKAASDFDLLWLSPQKPELLVVTAAELIRYRQSNGQYSELERLSLEKRLNNRQGNGLSSDLVVLWGEDGLFVLNLDED
ncbi:MAG: hypothetical protein CMK59_04050 [Proteobacteria bacterium]|nr:hypothetical protein [Pseudomonadota bacterium]